MTMLEDATIEDAVEGNLERSGDVAMARYASGDDAAFTAVYAAVVPRLTRYLGRRVADRELVQDLVQETLLRVHRARATFLAGAAVMPWVLGIARRQLVDAHRGRRREMLIDVEPPSNPSRRPALVEGPASAEEIFVAKQVAGCLNDAYARLSPPQRAAFELVKGRGLSLVEAARALGTSVTGVKLRTHRAYRTLRTELAAA
jgi:RNA polymerase sigma-70 factor (ECF subfamily)